MGEGLLSWGEGIYWGVCVRVVPALWPGPLIERVSTFS